MISPLEIASGIPYILLRNGNVDKDKTIQELNKIFPKKENGKKFDYQTYSSKIPTVSAPRKTIQNMPQTQTAWIMLGWQTNGVLNKKDYATLQVIDSKFGIFAVVM